MEKLPTPKDIIGDTIGYVAPRYEQIPPQYGFDNIVPDANRCPLTYAKWDELINFAKRYYAKFEVNGETYIDFANNLQLYYDKGSDTFERLLEVYDDDIAKPILGRDEVTEYDLVTADDRQYANNSSEDTNGTNEDNNTTTNNLKTSGTNSNQTDNIDVPVDANDPNTQTPSSIIKDNGSNSTSNTGTVTQENTHTDDINVSRNESGNDNNTHTQMGTVKTHLSDLGVRPNYESLNGFLDNNRTYYDVFVWLFRDCFSINDFLVW